MPQYLLDTPNHPQTPFGPLAQAGRILLSPWWVDRYGCHAWFLQCWIKTRVLCMPNKCLPTENDISSSTVYWSLLFEETEPRVSWEQNTQSLQTAIAPPDSSFNSARERCKQTRGAQSWMPSLCVALCRHLPLYIARSLQKLYEA